jgi:methylmalonyl-CoA mutase N-terminal domain/subunit
MGQEKALYDPEALQEIKRQKKRWLDEVYHAEKERQTVFQTMSGIPIQPLYGPDDVAQMDYLRDLGFPSEEPFVRGVYPTMYRGRIWTQRQLAGFGPPEETNRRYKYLLEQGATGINGVFDYPTLRGYDSTHPLARADVGRGGVAVDTLEDMGILFDGIPIDRVSSSLVASHPIANITLQSMYFANAQQRGVPLSQLAGTSQNDFLMETTICIAPEVLPPRASFKLCCDAIQYCTHNAPRWNPVSFSGYNYREAGCNAVQEAAFVIANALACTEELIRRGENLDSFAPRLSFFFSSHSDFFEEIAKYRAARRLWARLLKERFEVKNPRSLALRFHVQTSGVSLTAQQPLNNIARASYQALAAVLGGAQSVHVDGYDEALCTPTELSAITALRTQQILQHETRVTHTIDPLGGSYFVESLTREMETRINDLICKIDDIGGIVKAVEQGWVHQEISNSAYELQLAMEAGDMPVVGVNCFQMDQETFPGELFQVPETLPLQTRKLQKIRQERDPGRVQSAMEHISHCCERDGNLMEVLVEAVKSHVTLGEVSGILRSFYGTWSPPLF